jgi:quercetin dioxygenase-like cupin family protein
MCTGSVPSILREDHVVRALSLSGDVEDYSTWSRAPTTRRNRQTGGRPCISGAAGKVPNMELQSKQPTVKGPEETFTGNVWFDVIARGDDYSRMRVNVVRFAPCARTAWHAHPGGQTLYVTEGRGLVQSRGGDVIEIRPGDVIYTPPGKWHWHGAAPDHFMTHIAMWEMDDQGNSATWGALVTDEEYRSPATDN